jgi:hypothetical protein
MMSNYALERSVTGLSERAGRASRGPLNADVRSSFTKDAILTLYGSAV